MGTTPANSMNLNSTTSGLVNWDGTATMSTTALTQYNVLVGASANTIQSEAPGTAGQALISNGATSYPTFQAIPFTKMPWSDKATSFNAVSNNGYNVTAVATATLPSAPAQGDLVAIVYDASSAVVTITANTGQFIRVGKQITLAAGTILSNFQGDAITLEYRSSDLTWIAWPGVQGTWTVTTS